MLNLHHNLLKRENMLHKSKPIPSVITKKCNIMNSDSTEVYHPLSYYLLGGVDLSGEALDKSDSAEYDSAEDIAELDAGGFNSVPYGDPRESKFTLVEKYGPYEASKIASESANPMAEVSGSAE